MARPASEHPTELELSILKILWEQSPLPVREIRDALAEQGRDLAHTSVITTLNTMFEKKQVKRKKIANAFHFSPRVSQSQISKRMLGDIVDRVFDGSASAVMLSLFEASEIDDQELKELRSMINRVSQEKKAQEKKQ